MHSLSRGVAAKSIYDRLGIDQQETDENAGAPQLLAQSIAQPALTVATALPFNGNLRAGALIPVIVQPRLISLSEEAYSAPYAGRAHNPETPIAGARAERSWET